jgi:hypothetical protein
MSAAKYILGAWSVSTLFGFLGLIRRRENTRQDVTEMGIRKQVEQVEQEEQEEQEGKERKRWE